jgi:hypothetical protein
VKKIEIPQGAYEIALSLAKQRAGRFRNQFTTKKLREQIDDPDLSKHIEGVFGYLGDMCAAIYLGIDPYELMRNMVLDTDLLTHRDECDIIYRGNRIDVKTEFYPEEKFQSVIDGTIKPKETYGCRLINDNQFRENSKNIDIYFFATIDNLDPRKAKYWYPVGWLTTTEAKNIAPNPMWWSPSGARLWTPAHCLPNNQLKPNGELLDVVVGKFKDYNTDHKVNPKYSSVNVERFEEILSKSNLLVL